MNAILTQNLCKTYGDVRAVNGLNLSVEEGELFALLGVNGAGKTTTIKMLSCLTRPTSGDAQILGHSVTNDAINVKKRINVSPQETAVAPNLSVKENLLLICGLYGDDKKTAREKTAQMIERLVLQDVEKRRAGTLSGGWQRRLSIAMALCSDPKVLFLDEPSLGLDVLVRRELWDVIRELKGHVTIVLTTHYLEEAEALCDRVGVMAHGRLVAVGTPRELIEKTNKASFEDAFVELCR